MDAFLNDDGLYENLSPKSVHIVVPPNNLPMSTKMNRIPSQGTVHDYPTDMTPIE